MKTIILDYKNIGKFYSQFICPYCNYMMLEGEEEDTSDCGCPSCRKLIDWEQFN